MRMWLCACWICSWMVRMTMAAIRTDGICLTAMDGWINAERIRVWYVHFYDRIGSLQPGPALVLLNVYVSHLCGRLYGWYSVELRTPLFRGIFGIALLLPGPKKDAGNTRHRHIILRKSNQAHTWDYLGRMSTMIILFIFFSINHILSPLSSIEY